MQDTMYDAIVLGSGPAGLTAAIYTSRAHLKTLVLSGNPPGGQLATTTDVENFPGFPNGIMGPKLIENMRRQTEKFGAKFENKNGKSIIISRNMTMTFMGNMDTWMPFIIGFAIFYYLIGEYYLLFWSLCCLIFQFGYLFNAIRKYCDKHYSLLLYFPISAWIHLYMFLRQFSLPKEMSWEKTPMLLDKSEEEITALSTK